MHNSILHPSEIRLVEMPKHYVQISRDRVTGGGRVSVFLEGKG